jgi:beta-N-acetylhexosaminidase
MIDLTAKPFYLKPDDIQWVEETIAGMSFDEKVTQLFCMTAYDDNEAFLKNVSKNVRPGGLMCRPMPTEAIVRTVDILQKNARIPMLIAANLEKGGNGGSEDGTMIGPEMLVAATDDVAMAGKLGTVCGREGAAVGINWAFAPIIDIDYNFRNPITNTRTFGSDVWRVRKMGVAYVEAVQKEGVAATIKHFPGDGRDERDQHLVVSINDMSCEEWDETYGAAYKAAIEAGAMTAMIGHIMQPAYSRKLNPSLCDEDILPASLAPELMTGLLREQLGFNGLIVTDATTMAGMVIPMPRWKAVPQTIAAGADMFLFTKSLDEDIAYMRKGIEEGVVTEKRLHEALTRILALKAALGLHKKQADGSLVPSLDAAKKMLGNEEHKRWAKEAADKAVTLVKVESGVLPLSPKRYKKVLFYAIESELGFAYSVRGNVANMFMARLKKEGFDIDKFEPKPGFEGMLEPYKDVIEKYDLIVYLANMATKSNQTIVRIEWALPMGANVPVYSGVIPTIFVSVENPYHLIDVPRVRTFINAYCSSDTVLDAVVDKLMGRSSFKGINPVDPFCGMWDTHLS